MCGRSRFSPGDVLLIVLAAALILFGTIGCTVHKVADEPRLAITF